MMQVHTLALVLLLSVSARAQVRSPPSGSARAAFQAGIEAIDAGRYADGVEHLERSLELLPRVSTAYNLAVARRGTGDFLGARETLRALLEGAYGRTNAATRGRAEQLLSEAVAEIATLRIEVGGGAPIRVTVDGETAGVLNAPGHVETEVNPGARLVGATAPDTEPAERLISVAPGTTEALSFRLLPRLDDRPGHLELISTDPEARVEVVGHRGAPGQLSLDLSAGEYTVRVIGAHGTREDRVRIPAGRRIRLELSPAAGGGDNAWVWAVIAAGVAAALGLGAWIGWELYEPTPVGSPDWMTVPL